LSNILLLKTLTEIDSTVGTLYLVRHGQASFGASDYDNLSELGAEQGRMLGAWFGQAKIAPTQLISGGLRRHQQTARAWAEGFASAGGVLPQTQRQQIDARWNEYDHEDIFSKAARAFGLEGELNKTMEKKAFQKLFEKAIARWIAAPADTHYNEPWVAFNARCSAALTDVQKMRGDVVVVFTSGGTIGATVSQVLGLGPQQAMQFNYLIANCSVSKLVYRDEQISLATFNSHGLFETQSETLTYR
jgi:broad specificity phosphatase PhoE